jgi:hypothetical protein
MNIHTLGLQILNWLTLHLLLENPLIKIISLWLQTMTNWYVVRFLGDIEILINATNEPLLCKNISFILGDILTNFILF